MIVNDHFTTLSLLIPRSSTAPRLFSLVSPDEVKKKQVVLSESEEKERKVFPFFSRTFA